MFRELLAGADNPVPAITVTQGYGHQPADALILLQFLVGTPADVIGGVTDVKDRVQQQVQLTAASAHDQVGAGDGAGKGLLHFGAKVLNAQKQGDAERQGQGYQRQYPAPIPEACHGQRQCQPQVHGVTSRASWWLKRWARLLS